MSYNFQPSIRQSSFPEDTPNSECDIIVILLLKFEKVFEIT